MSSKADLDCEWKSNMGPLMAIQNGLTWYTVRQITQGEEEEPLRCRKMDCLCLAVHHGRPSRGWTGRDEWLSPGGGRKKKSVKRSV